MVDYSFPKGLPSPLTLNPIQVDCLNPIQVDCDFVDRVLHENSDRWRANLLTPEVTKKPVEDEKCTGKQDRADNGIFIPPRVK